MEIIIQEDQAKTSVLAAKIIADQIKRSPIQFWDSRLEARHYHCIKS